ncbi:MULTISPECIES: DNA repair protein [unclassified Pseudomonas]|jgi:chromosome segregation ATPase|uniref:DNA repair protein n=1 Tax=unclassified Pseudomonas TaxID=196821 RepID=UPI000C81B0D9|nr:MULTISPECIES: DNA repair protein [unclassified Pseudomonas]MDX9669339.1 DNA repair protein [Pseudomonas sp. P8_250]PMQ12675.1 Chromosome partition protein Smc [Pseudomonas sp. AD21]WPN36618.1 DNA repair protein [Pseudomonas sp. P8_139]WPN41581.1 DNA repair protein [Pseudomonas sp. P8_229]
MHARVLLLGLSFFIAQGASAEGMEERLRTQLRSTTQQLQALQSQQAQASAAQLAAQNEARAAQAQIKQLTAELAKAKGVAEQLADQQQILHSQAQAQVAASNEQTGKFKKAYDELLVMARAKEAERSKLQAQLAERDTQVQQCSVKNQQMYGVAKQILTAYENIDVAEVMKIRQPFAGSARVKFDELAQGFGDELYKTQFDAPQAALAH